MGEKNAEKKDEKIKFLDSSDEKSDNDINKSKKKKKSKKITLKEMDQQVITERDRGYSDNSDYETDQPSTSKKGKSYFEEQEIRNSIRKAQREVSDENRKAVKVRTVAEETDEEEYRKYVKG